MLYIDETMSHDLSPSRLSDMLDFAQGQMKRAERAEVLPDQGCPERERARAEQF